MKKMCSFSPGAANSWNLGSYKHVLTVSNKSTAGAANYYQFGTSIAKDLITTA